MQPPPPPPCDCYEDQDAFDEAEERKALGRIVLGFQTYARMAELEVARWEANFSMLPDRHKEILRTSQMAKFKEARRCIHVNQFFIKSMLSSFEPDDDDEDMSGGPTHLMHAAQAAREVEEEGHRISYLETDKIRYVLKNLSRDWSVEGKEEREQCYGPILSCLTELLGSDLEASTRSGGEVAPPSILIPGAGLGRLCCEVAGLGMQAQGCEFSYHMLLMSSFVLNCLGKKDLYTIHPWIHSNCNQRTDEDQLRPVLIPDVSPADIVSGPGLLSMCAGDFLDVYSEKPGKERQVFDAVVTCFFIDTAHNVLQYLETIHGSLRPGGYWINLGPLLYHWANSPADEDMSIELSLDEIRRCALQMGFRLIKEEPGLPAGYLMNSKALYNSSYIASFWVMQRE